MCVARVSYLAYIHIHDLSWNKFSKEGRGKSVGLVNIGKGRKEGEILLVFSISIKSGKEN